METKDQDQNLENSQDSCAEILSQYRQDVGHNAIAGLAQQESLALQPYRISKRRAADIARAQDPDKQKALEEALCQYLDVPVGSLSIDAALERIYVLFRHFLSPSLCEPAFSCSSHSHQELLLALAQKRRDTTSIHQE